LINRTPRPWQVGQRPHHAVLRLVTYQWANGVVRLSHVFYNVFKFGLAWQAQSSLGVLYHIFMRGGEPVHEAEGIPSLVI